MDLRVIHLGSDDFHRIEILRREGYDVVQAGSLTELTGHLQRSEVNCHAVAISEDFDLQPAAVLRAIRRETGAPVILFRQTNRDIDERGFDRVIACLTPPREWLHETASLIAEHHGLSNAAD